MKCMLTIANHSNSVEFIDFALQHGISDFRVNMAYEADALRAFRHLEMLKNKDINVFVDYPGEKPRLQLDSGKKEILVHAGDLLTISLVESAGNYITHVSQSKDRIKEKQQISFSDGKIIGQIIKKQGDAIVVRFTSTETTALRNNAGCCFVGEDMPCQSISRVYCSSILPSVKMIRSQKRFCNIWVVLSFVDDPNQIKEFVRCMNSMGIRVMAKIETPKGVENLDGIAEIVDGIMIGRGDLKNISGVNYRYVYGCALRKLKKLPSSIYKGVGTFFLLNYSMTKKVTKKEIVDIRRLEKYESDFFMLSKEVVNSNYPGETVLMSRQILSRD